MPAVDTFFTAVLALLGVVASAALIYRPALFASLSDTSSDKKLAHLPYLA